MKYDFKSFFIGKPLSDRDLSKEKLNVLWGLPIYSSDAISSVAYAGEEILIVLVAVLGFASYKYFIGITLAITLLLLILVVSYRQTISAYPQGGGAFIVANDNLGRIPGLIAGSSLIIGYILTVAVSACAGTAAIESAYPSIAPYKALISFGIVFILTWGNLRGIRESSVLFGVPTYFFIATMLIMIITGFVKVFFLGYEPPEQETMIKTTKDISLFLLLRAFASGCTALTGVEAVSNGVPSFRHPAVRNSQKVLSLLALIIFIVFFGVSSLTGMYKILPSEEMTVLSQLAAAIFGSGHVMFFVVQIATVVILALAANTAFAGMPVLMAIIASDGYIPRQLASRGSRLNYSNGILLLFAASSLLIFLFNADTHLLLPLYATGVFMSFTLSQYGMFKHWRGLKCEGWKHRAAINGLGAIVTALTCGIIAVSRFKQGAWIVLICIPVFVIAMLVIKRHYNSVAEDLALEKNTILCRGKTLSKTIIPMSGINRSFVKAFRYAMAIGGELEVYHVAPITEDTVSLMQQFETLNIPAKLVVETTEYRNINEILLRHIKEEESKLGAHEMLTVVMPQIVLRHWWQFPLHNQTTLHLKSAMAKYRRVSVVSIPYLI